MSLFAEVAKLLLMENNQTALKIGIFDQKQCSEKSPSEIDFEIVGFREL